MHAVVGLKYGYLLSLPIHTFCTWFPLGWSIQPQAAELCGHCLQDGQAWT